MCISVSVSGLLDDSRACLIRASKYRTIGLQMSNNSTSGWKIITINTNLTLKSCIVWPWAWRICNGGFFHSWINGIDVVNYFHIKSEISLHTGVKGKIVKIGTICMIRKLLKGETVAWFSGSVCMCVFLPGVGVELWGERTHVDKSYGHQSGPAHSMPKSIVPLIIRGRHPHRVLHTASFIPADLFAQQTFCFGLGDL